jgi:hypothetical protein
MTLVRYFTLFDPIIEYTVYCDSDNYPTEIFIDIIKKWVDDTKDKESSMLLFKPMQELYTRKNSNGNDVD